MLLVFLWFLDTYGPRLEDCRGDEEMGIQRFLLFLFVLLLVIIGMSPPIVWIPDRDIQE